MDLDLEKVLQKVSGIKLPGGVVGKVSAVLIVTSLCIGGLAVASGNQWIIGGGIGAILILVFPMLWRIINFADRNPQAALLEGAEFLVHQQLLLGTKQNPLITVSPESYAEEHPAEPPSEKLAQLDETEDVELLPPPSNNTGRRDG